MTDNLFDNAKFGDIFYTTENKQAVFLRFAENAEYKFAILYVEGWGNVQVFRHNGKAIYDDSAHSIISKKEEPQVKEMTEAHLEKYCQMCFQHNFCHLFNGDKPRIETCLIRSGIENGYKKAIDDIEQQTNKDFLCWRRAFECVAETPDGKSTHEDIWTLDTERGFLYYIPAGSTTARCLLLKDLLDKLPKENGL